ncbi:unnamed protein product [Phaedon cochleariae]|uniref:Uncharacterized protein n=1 Tax=Phaedon cochleariae TaxID=80249 RepID=A0A9N9X5Z6_PHACE|nr:unnamed protein product [Phaedon cochleariae]
MQGWSSRSCVEKKHFICQTKIRTVTHKDKKKLQRQYNANKYNKLNEILAPSLPEYENGTFSLKSNVPIQYRFEINKNLNDEAMFAFSPKDTTVKERKRKRKRKSRKSTLKKLANGTLIEVPKLRRRGSRKKKQNELMDSGQHTLMKNIRWRTYKKKEESNPLYPSPIVEEYNYVKEY